MCDFSRGDIVFVKNPMQTPHGHVVAGNHPTVVIQNDAGNEHSNNLIIAYMHISHLSLKDWSFRHMWFFSGIADLRKCL